MTLCDINHNGPVFWDTVLGYCCVDDVKVEQLLLDVRNSCFGLKCIRMCLPSGVYPGRSGNLWS